MCKEHCLHNRNPIYVEKKGSSLFLCIYFKLFQSIASCQLLKLNIRKEAFQFCTAALTSLRRGYGSRSLWIMDKIIMPMMIYIANSCTWIYLQYGCIFIQQLLFKICRRLFNLSRVDSNIFKICFSCENFKLDCSSDHILNIFD